MCGILFMGRVLVRVIARKHPNTQPALARDSPTKRVQVAVAYEFSEINARGPYV